MEVKTIIIHGDLEEEIDMKQLEGFTMKEKEELVVQAQEISLWFETITYDVVLEVLLIHPGFGIQEKSRQPLCIQ